MPVSDQQVQRAGSLVDDDKLHLLTDLHSETDLGEGCTPVGRQLGLAIVKPSPPSCRIERFVVAPKLGIVMKGSLRRIKNTKSVVIFEKNLIKGKRYR